MRHVTKEQLKDCSTADRFCFSMACADCGKVWKSTPVSFSKAGLHPPTEGKQIIFDILYQKEKEAAANKAVEEAAAAFNRCPICKMLVCDHCFMICEEIDMCSSCATRLQERGEPVLQCECV